MGSEGGFDASPEGSAFVAHALHDLDVKAFKPVAHRRGPGGFVTTDDLVFHEQKAARCFERNQHGRPVKKHLIERHGDARAGHRGAQTRGLLLGKRPHRRP